MKLTKQILLTCLCSVLAGSAWGQAPITITVDPQAPGRMISPDFIGLSFEMQMVLPDRQGGYYFSPTNRPLIAVFKTLGIRSLRVGGNTADRATVKVPGPADIDSLFAFARVAGVKVIYTLRLRGGDPDQAAAIAKYIWQRYRAQLDCFAIGNEPNVFTSQYPVYRREWKKYTGRIAAPTNAPGAKFCGPSATPGRTAWAREFAGDFGHSGLLAFISQHDYPGGAGNRATNVVAARERMLSAAWLEHYTKFHDAFVPAATSSGLRYRIEEANNFYNGGARDVSDTFASALWGLDYLCWWASHDALGVNFHTGDRVAAGGGMNPCRYATFWSAKDGYDVHPIGYGIKAFDLACHGRMLPLDLVKPPNVNLTAYAILGVAGSEETDVRPPLYLTIINKEQGSAARRVEVATVSGEPIVQAAVMFLRAPGNDVSEKTGITLGGAAIKNDATWNGSWSPLRVEATGKRAEVVMPSSCAAIVKLELSREH